jgi:hypothetical protein
MHIDLWHLDEPEGFGENRQPYRTFPKGDMAMDLDLETFLTALYVIVDDLYQGIFAQRPVKGDEWVSLDRSVGRGRG